MKINNKDNTPVISVLGCTTGKVYWIQGKSYLKIVGYNTQFNTHIKEYSTVDCKPFLDLETSKIVLIPSKESAILLCHEPEISI